MTTEAPRKKPGREPGKHKLYPHQHAVRFTEAGWKQLHSLAQRLNVSEAEVIRQAVERLAQEEGV